MKQDISTVKEKIVFGDDSVVIRKYVGGIPGGRTLDCSDFTEDNILSGHVIIVKDGVYKPLPVADGKYSALPEGATFAGVLYRSVSKAQPAAAIMDNGVVNSECVPYPMDGILEAFKTACPHITFEKDEEA